MLFGDSRAQLEAAIRQALTEARAPGEAEEVVFAEAAGELPGALIPVDGVVGVTASRVVFASVDSIEGMRLRAWSREQLGDIAVTREPFGGTMRFKAPEGDVRLVRLSDEAAERLARASSRALDAERDTGSPSVSAPLMVVTPAPAETRCPSCGKAQRSGFRFCLACGSDLTLAPAEETSRERDRGLALQAVRGPRQSRSFSAPAGDQPPDGKAGPSYLLLILIAGGMMILSALAAILLLM